MRESKIEKRIKAEVEAAGGEFWKFTSPGLTGVPDRLKLMPGGRLTFVELKSPCGRLSVRQIMVMNRLKELGFEVEVINQ